MAAGFDLRFPRNLPDCPRWLSFPVGRRPYRSAGGSVAVVSPVVSPVRRAFTASVSVRLMCRAAFHC